MKKLLNVVTLVALALVFASPALAQRPEKPFEIQARAGYNLPTGNIADWFDGAFGFGAGFGYYFTDKLVIMGEFDFGSHNGKEEGVDPGFTGAYKEEIMHFMGKLGYVVFQSADGKMKILVNAGAGAMNLKFKADNLPNDETETKFAINAGAKLYYMFTPTIGIVISPQGDIAFTKKDEADPLSSSSKWVWPLTAGLAVNF